MIITLSNNNIAATINSYGAELSRLEKNNQNYIWTIDEAFLNRHLPLDGWSWVGNLADVPGAWPFGKQLLLLGTRLQSGEQGTLVF
jgi:hypothetical protein